jgi:membrane protein implicated in regulation of membrane protease activity
MMQQDPLSALHDISLPTAISAWPPALGWWLNLGGLIMSITLGIFFGRRYYQRRQKRERYLTALRALTPQSNTAYYAALNRLLKQICLAYRGPAGNTLSGEAWLAYLDKCARKAFFLPAFADFAQAIDNPNIQLDATALQRTCEQWLRAMQ